MSHFLFNKLYILQSLADKDQKTGEELEKRINAFSIQNHINFQAVTFDLHSMDDWNRTWDGIYTSISQLNIIPIIHLVMHGNESKIGIEKGLKGIIDLSELFEKTRKANILSHNNIMLTMAVCKGLNVIKYIKMGNAMPFCSILASQESLCNSVSLENFTIYYQTLLQTGNIDTAFNCLHQLGGEQDKYTQMKSEQLFANVMETYLKDKCNDKAIEERCEEIAKMGGFDISNAEAKKALIDTVKAILPEENVKGYENFVNSFFMFDRYPAISDRFDIPKTLDEFLKWVKKFKQ